MVDVFGGTRMGLGSRGKRGPPGPKGPRGVRGLGGIDDMCKWLPKTMLKNIRELEERCCYLLSDLKKDVQKNKSGEIVEWISRSNNKINLKGKVPTKAIVELPNEKGYALAFHKSHYYADLIPFMSAPVYGFLCITFRTQQDEDQSLVSNFDPDNPDEPFNEISVSKSTIFIIGYESEEQVKVSIKHNCQKWTTFFIDWIVKVRSITGSYVIDGDKKLAGTFSFTKNPMSSYFIDVGSRSDGTMPFTGDISALELYNPDKGKIIPSSLKDLVIQNQTVKTYEDIDDQPLLRKRRRTKRWK